MVGPLRPKGLLTSSLMVLAPKVLTRWIASWTRKQTSSSETMTLRIRRGHANSGCVVGNSVADLGGGLVVSGSWGSSERSTLSRLHNRVTSSQEDAIQHCCTRQRTFHYVSFSFSLSSPLCSSSAAAVSPPACRRSSRNRLSLTSNSSRGISKAASSSSIECV